MFYSTCCKETACHDHVLDILPTDWMSPETEVTYPIVAGIRCRECDDLAAGGN
jgi:hypothetical protein